MRSKLCTTIGIILVVVSAIGLLLAGGTLISLPSIVRLLRNLGERMGQTMQNEAHQKRIIEYSI